MDNQAISNAPQTKPEYGDDFDTYDRHIVPGETAARKEREGDIFKTKPTEEGETDPESIHTMGGYTVDKEGLVNNFAIEPEMYINEPGDLREKHKQEARERAQELNQLNEDRDGELTMEQDKRGKGPGFI